MGLLLVTCFLGLLVVACAIPSGFGRKKDFVPTLRDDIKYVQCEMCELTAKHAHRLIAELRKSLPKWKMLTEAEIIAQLELMCNVAKEEGDWISRLDIQEDGAALRVVEMPTLGDCRRECHTLAKICADLTGDVDTDLSELLYKQPSRSEVTNALCHEWSSSCEAKPPPFTGPRRAGEDFVPLDDDMISLKRTMDSMGQQGMSGSLFSRDSVMDQLKDYEHMLEDYDMDIDDLAKIAAAAGTGAGPGGTEGGAPPLDLSRVGSDSGDEL